MTFRVRFAPSPTGSLHIGTVRTALFNWLIARKKGGKFILRIEDTDLARSERKFEQTIFDGLNWLGLNWDEGPFVDGPFGPYRQSERIEQHLYQDYAQKLLDEGKAYYCFCTEADLDQEREQSKKDNMAYVYSQKCTRLSKEEIAQKIASGQPYAIRFKIDTQETITINDQIRGQINFDPRLISDFIMIKSDQTPSYNFAVVIDDALMQITDVIRGEDHISNTARQIQLFKAINYPLPNFAHLPMILGQDRSKLSKRHGATSVTEYQEMGYLPEALFNYLSMLGWAPPEGKEILSKDEIVQLFSIEKINKSNAIFDLQKLSWLNGQYIRKLSKEELFAAVKPYFTAETNAQLASFSTDIIAAMVFSVRDNLVVLKDINQYLALYLYTPAQYQAQVSRFSFNDDEQKVIKLFSQLYSKLTSSLIEEDWQNFIAQIKQETQLGNGKIFKPLRQVITGEASGPHLLDFCQIMGNKLVLERLAAV